MSKGKKKNPSARYERELKRLKSAEYSLRLYITGVTPASTRAITNLKHLCEKYLKGRYKLRVIDIFQQPTLARSDQIVAAPTLVKLLPIPLRKFIGDLSDTEGILLALDIAPPPAMKP